MSDAPLSRESLTPSGFRDGVMLGVRRGLHGFLWIARILLPVSLVVALLDWTGWLYALDSLFTPIMALINLPPQAALPIISALFTSFYAAVAMMVVIPFSPEQYILMAVFITIAHMLVVEGLIQHKAGINGIAITSIRLVAAGVAVYVVSQFFSGTELPVVMPDNLGERGPLTAALHAWLETTTRLLFRVFIIIVSVMVVLETLKRSGASERIARIFRPFMVVLGLSPGVTPIWVTGTFFGIVYGSAVIAEESASGRYTDDELRRLHISLGISHSVVEDPALFLAVGVGLQWTVLPRLIAAALVVHIYRLSRAVRTRLQPVQQGQEL
jgi:hypothetical protein